jgi:nucleotide-binding universal stress UspA family protein
LIVLGCSKRSSLLGFFPGSVLGRVIEASSRDVLVIPQSKVLSWDKILLVLDGSDAGCLAAERAIGLALSFSGMLSVLFVSPYLFTDNGKASVQAREMVERIRRRAEQMGVHAQGFVRKGTISRKIVELAAQLESDLIFLGDNPGRGLHRILPLSLPERITRRSSCSLFIAKTPEQQAELI